jgi:1-acyl-sn-glycerol-3-phosphate acyltransferase
MSFVRRILFVLYFYGALGYVGARYAFVAGRSPRGVVRALHAWTHLTLWGLKWIVGARVTIEGRENLPQGPALIAAKHQATLDTLLPSLFLDFPAFVYKVELKKAPVVGWYLQKGEMIAVEREAQAAALKSLLRASRKSIADGRQIVIFPEGTRQDLDAAPDYKSGIVALYRDLNMPVVPVALNTGLVWPAHGIKYKPGDVIVKILPPIPPGLSREDFMRRLEDTVERESQALLPPHLRRSVPA